MADISSVALAAKCVAKVSFKAVVASIKSTIGETTAPNFHQDMDRMYKHIYGVIGAYVQDPCTLARKPAMKDGVNLGTVQDMVTKIMSAAALPDAAGPTAVDEDVVSYAVGLVFIPIWERMGYLSAANTTVQSNEDHARSFLSDFASITAGALTTTELTRATLMQATDQIDPLIGRSWRRAVAMTATYVTARTSP